MTAEWRERVIRMPQYRPELDLVVCAPDGSLAGFCVGWLDSERSLAQIEPIGVHPRFQRMGLGRVLLLEILQRFREQGARSAIVEPMWDNLAMLHTCQSVGFRQSYSIHRKGIWIDRQVL